VGGGTLLILAAYYLVSNKKIASISKIYQFMNFFGAIGVGVNVFYQKAWPGFALETVWAVIAFSALWKIFRS
jgi:hypothetical protein